MGKNVILGGLVGGVIAYIVLSIVHMATGLGEVGIKNLPAEAVLAPAMKLAIHDPGFYFFPGMEVTPGMTKEQQHAAMQRQEQKWLEGPTGILIYSPGGTAFSFPKLLGIQFAITLVSGFLLAWLMAMAGGGLPNYGAKVLFAAVVALFAGVFIDLPYWNWYGFPMDYTIAHTGTGVVSWAIAALGMAKVIK
ncbi:MAG TPA: hypothetical protein VEG64_17115 [Candidatus Sulfotelmatobacter sp.]|nr:hypothetical protein [Candidatus Sulfotelmatobacter sp.]